MTAAPTAAEIAAARQDLTSMLPDACTIQRAVVVSDGGGGQTETWPALATGVACRLTPAVATGTGATVAGDRLDATTTHIITLATGTDIKAGDRILIAATTYEALVVGDGGAWELARHVQVRQAA